MDEKTKILISLGAATAANCIPCFEHLYYQAKNLELGDEEIQETVDIAVKVKNGAHVAIKSVIKDIMGEELKQGEKADPNDCPCSCA